MIDGSLAWAVCSLQELIAGGDHTIAIGRVTAMGLGERRAAAVVRGPTTHAGCPAAA